LAGAKVISPYKDRLITISDSKGHFEIEPEYGWHAAYMVGPVSYSLFPYFDMPSFMPSFLIDAKGYQSTTIPTSGKIITDKNTGDVIIRLQPE